MIVSHQLSSTTSLYRDKIHIENAHSIEERFLVEKYPMRICCGLAEILRRGGPVDQAGLTKRRSYGKARDRLVQRVRTKITPECVSSTAWMQAFMIGATNLS